MRVLRNIADWLKYERLHHYPALAVFEKPEALKRLQVYEREEHNKSQPWLNIAWLLIAAWMICWTVATYGDPIRLVQGLMFFVFLPGWLLQNLVMRGTRRRIQAKVAAELRDGRLWTCLECGYDLRVTDERCPECGADVRTAATKRAS